MDLVSIIIPAYNVDQYIGRCVESVISQTYENLDIIMIDDGSTDDTPLILEQWKEKDRRITVEHQKNAGVSSARNRGMKLARGKYLAFVDADDWLEKECIEKLYHAIVQYDTDVVIFPGNIKGDRRSRFSNYGEKNKEVQIMDRRRLLNAMFDMKNSNVCPFVCNKFYRRDLLVRKNLYFSEEIHMGEDLYFLYQLFLSIDRAVMLTGTMEEYYHYIRRNDSATNQKTYKTEITQTVPFERILQMDTSLLDDKTMDYLYSFIGERTLHCYLFCKKNKIEIDEQEFLSKVGIYYKNLIWYDKILYRWIRKYPKTFWVLYEMVLAKLGEMYRKKDFRRKVKE